MPDPHVLYIVTAVVVLGLVAWVVAVLSRPPRDDSPPQEPREKEKKEGAKSSAAKKAAASAQAAESAERAGRLDSHSEIRDAAADASADLPIDFEEEEEQTGPTALILVTAVARTDPGLKRKHNE